MIITSIFKAIVGSQSYGTQLPVSDIDYKGVYCQNIDDIVGFNYKEQIERGKDRTYYEIRRFIQLLKTANPTVLELLFSPEDCIIEKHPAFDILVNHRDMFLTKKCLHSFGGYAVQQIQKAIGLNKKMNWENNRIERKTVLDFCYFYEDGKTIPLIEKMKLDKMKEEYCGLVKLEHFRDAYALYYDYQQEFGQATNRTVSPMGYRGLLAPTKEQLILSEVPKYAHPVGIIYWNKDAYTIHCRDFNQYQTWVRERNEARYVETNKHGQRIDGKNLLHCRRMIDMAKEIAIEKTVRVRRPNAEYLLSIRNGMINLNELIQEAEKDISDLDELFKNSSLPDSVDDEICNSILLKIRHSIN